MTIMPLPAPQDAAPFVWGKGGRRMTPEDIAREREMAAALMGVDFSPVQHWTQGLARVAGNALGGIRERRADRASQENAAESNYIANLLLGQQEPVSPGGEVPAPGGNLPSTGRPMLPNADGTVSTEESITVTDPRVNGGAPTNIPSIWGGKRTASEDEAITAALASGQSFQPFQSIDEAVQAARARSDMLGREVDQVYRQRPMIDPVVQALTSPYIDDTTKRLAMQQYTARNKNAEPIEIAGKLVDPVTFKVLGDFSTPDMFTQMISSAGIDPSAPEGMDLFRKRAVSLADPIVSVPLPGGGMYTGPRSEMAATLARAGIGGSGASASPPATLPPDFDFNEGGPTPSASGGFPGN